jgi:beta-lactamase regulating signal transducer with metallopeptidase domain
MIASIAGFLAAHASAFTGALAEGAIKGSLILVTGIGLARVMRGQSAARRHLVLGLAIVAAAVVPAMSRVIPSWSVVVPAAIGSALLSVAPDFAAAAASDRAAAEHSSQARSVVAASVSYVQPDSRAIGRAVSPVSLATALTLAWLLVAAFLVARVLASLMAVARLTRRATLVTDAGWHGMLTDAARSLGVQRNVRLLASDDTEVPMTWGVVRPVVLLTADHHEWSADRRRSVLRHELAHVARWDAVTELVAQACCAVYWFNPLVWVAARALRTERERACDDRVLAAGSRASEYAGELLDIARSALGAERHGVALAMARRSQIEGRLLSILDPRVRRDAPGFVPATMLSVVALALTLPLAAFRAAAPRTASVEPANVEPAPVVVAPIDSSAPMRSATPAAEHTAKRASRAADSAVRTVSQAAPRQVAPRCGGGNHSSSHSSSSTSDNGDRSWSANWSGTGCSADLRARGQIGFTADYSDVNAISAGGSFEITERLGDTVRHLEIRPNGGALTRTYTFNGQAMTFDNAGRAWLSAVLLDLNRQTGFAAHARVPVLLKSGGAPAVLEEIVGLGSDYVRGLYFTDLLTGTRLSGADLRQTVKTAGGTLTEDHQLQSVLATLTEQYPLRDDDLRAMFIDATSHLRADHARGDILDRIAESGPLTKASLMRALELTGGMQADYEIVRVLEQLGAHNQIEGEARDAYLRLAARLVDHNNRRAMDALRR